MERLSKKDEKLQFSREIAASKQVILTPYGNVMVPEGTALAKVGNVVIPMPVWVLDQLIEGTNG